MTKLSPYLTFSGNCREAMTFYKDSIGGELNIQTVAESQAASHMPDRMQDKVMHSTLTRDEFTLMASDMLSDEQLDHGNDILLVLECSSEEEINRCFSNLSSGGQVIAPLKLEFWGAVFGRLVDKYGVGWMFNFEKTKES